MTDGRGDSIDFTLWPDHCVQGTQGSELDQRLYGSLVKYSERGGEVKLARKVS